MSLDERRKIGLQALELGEVEFDVAGVRVAGLIRSYAEREGLVALIGSHGYLEIAERNGSAALRLGVAVGGRVRLANAGSRPRDQGFKIVG